MMKENITSIIVAMDGKRGIGRKGNLLFKIPEDFKRMNDLTRGHPIVMGRRTWDSLPTKPLSGRYNIVITRDAKFAVGGLKEGEGFVIVKSLEDGIEKAGEMLKQVQHDTEREIFIFGGGQIYAEAMRKKLIDKLYLTLVEGDFGADTFFPDYSEFKKVIFEKEGKSEGYKYKFLDLEK